MEPLSEPINVSPRPSGKLSEEEARAAAEALFKASNSSELPREGGEDHRRRYYGITVLGLNLLFGDNFSDGEIVVDPTVFPLPNSPDGFSGVFYWRGELVPVYALDLVLSATGSGDNPAPQAATKPGRYLMIMGLADNHIGFLFQELPKTFPVDNEAFKSLDQIRVEDKIFKDSDIAELLQGSVKTAARIDDSIYLQINWRELSRTIAHYFSKTNEQ